MDECGLTSEIMSKCFVSIQRNHYDDVVGVVVVAMNDDVFIAHLATLPCQKLISYVQIVKCFHLYLVLM